MRAWELIYLDFEAGYCTAEEAAAFMEDLRRLEMDAAEKTLAAFRVRQAARH
jgi:hypothetical protein